jgi:hypothetical protein
MYHGMSILRKIVLDVLSRILFVFISWTTHFRVEGLEHLHTLDPCIIVANHVCEVDPVVLFSLQTHSFLALRFIAADQVRNFPFVGPLIRWADTIFIKNGRDAYAVLEHMQLDNRHVVYFPEGTIYYRDSIARNASRCMCDTQEYKNVMCPRLGAHSVLTALAPERRVLGVTLHYRFQHTTLDALSKSDYLSLVQFFAEYPSEIVVKITPYTHTSVCEIFKEKDRILDALELKTQM